LTEVKILGEIDFIIKSDDLEKYKDLTLEKIAENLTKGLK